MGSLIQTFTFDRNTFRRTAEQSANSVAEHIQKVNRGNELDKTASNIVGALTSYMGIFEKTGAKFVPTKLADVFLKLYTANKSDSWQWLVARSLWRFVVPNGTASKVNGPASQLGANFAFFNLLLQLLTHLSAERETRRFLYFEELCTLLDDDANWNLSGAELFAKLTQARSEKESGFGSSRGFLDDLEAEFEIPRDNFNGLFSKAFAQTGFFSTQQHGGKAVAIALNSHLDSVLQRRLRFILDHPPDWTPNGGRDWASYMDFQLKEDLPEEVTSSDSEIADEAVDGPAQLRELVPAAKEQMDAASLKVTTEQLLRFAASLQSKRFLILTGLAGSGKTKLAQAFARWITPVATEGDPFIPGAKIPSERTTYYVGKADEIAVEFWNNEIESEATKVTLPREVISQWADYITEKSLSESTSARDLREGVKISSKFSDQLHSFETHLKAAAFALIKSRDRAVDCKCYSLVPVGADWTGNENIIGYPDGLRPPMPLNDGTIREGAYVTKPALDLITHAAAHRDIPHFLILDEMNLSHVERYFADLLSLIESKESVTLYCDQRDPDGLPTNTRGQDPTLTLPENVFIIGTVNVDETTYMFSPKVLDRANVVEFRVTPQEISDFLGAPKAPDLGKLDGRGKGFGSEFVKAASQQSLSLTKGEMERFHSEMNLFFAILRDHGAEFGYRVGHEAARFLHFYKLFGDSKVWKDGPTPDGQGWADSDSGNRDWFDRAFDAIVVQKFLPKLHGSKAKLGPLLRKVFVTCLEAHSEEPRNANAMAARLKDPKFIASSEEPSRDISQNARYPISAEKIFRMWRQLNENGFTSFAEN
jgi:hypothetical protein